MPELNVKDPAGLLKSIEDDEGNRSVPYMCTGNKETIGIGTNLRDNPPSAEALAKVGWTGSRNDVPGMVAFFTENPITPETAAEWLSADLEKFIAATRRIFPNFDEIGAKRQIALVNMCYNLGEGGLSKFSGMRRAIAVHNWPMAAVEALDSPWHRNDVPKRAVRIAKILAMGEVEYA